MSILISVLQASFRPGGVDILLAGMRDQTFPKDQFEVILADRRYELRHDRVMDLAREYGVNLIHVPEHRRNSQWCSFGSAWNTAAAVGRGDVLVFLQDWAYCPPGWIEAHLKNHDQEGRYVVGPYVYTQLPKIKFLKAIDLASQWDRGTRCTAWDAMLDGGVIDEVCAFEDGPFDPSWLARLDPLKPPDQDSRCWPPGPGVPDTYLHLKNESIRRHMFYNLNGFDERMERGKGPMDLEFGARLFEAGAELWWEPEAVHFSPNVRGLVRTMPWGSMRERIEGRWSYQDGLSFVERRRAEARIGKIRALNPYDMYDLAEQLEPWRRSDRIDVTPLDVDDLTYWGKEIWPETE